MLHFCASAPKATKKFLLSAVLLFSTLFSFAHRIELYSTTGCTTGSTLTVSAVATACPSDNYFSWQYKDNTGVWKCFTASSVINGTTFTVSGFSAANAGNNCPTLSISNATTALDNVQVRVLMCEGRYACGAPAGTQIWGGDDQALYEVKMFRLHVYSSPSDCGGTTPGCLGNVLVSGTSYYGGFESMVYNSSSSTFTNNNFGSNASSDYTAAGNNSTVPATSGVGTYQVLNNPYAMNYSNGKFAPHTGNFQMVIDGAASTQKRAWYKTVTVMPGDVYNFSAWVARTQGSNAFNIKLTANGTDINTSAVSATIGSWNQVAGTYTVPAGVTSIVISISDVSTAAERFFSLDDICFTQVSSKLALGDRVWYDTNNNGINESSENGIAGVTVHLYNDANNDNVADGAAIATDVTDANGYYSFTNLNAGNYIVGAVLPAGYMSSAVNGGDPDNNTDLDDNGQVSATGNEIRGLAITLSAHGEPGSSNTNNTYDFGMLPDCTCTTAAGNLLTNASFENGTTGWTASGGTLTTGTGYIACGAANGFNNWSSGTSKVYQDVNMTPGATVTFKGFAGIHTPGLTCSPMLSMIFLKADGTVLSQTNVAVTRDVDVNHAQLEQYSIVATAPALTAKVRIQSSTTCNTMKIDAFCLTAVYPTFTLGNTVWVDTNNNGIQDGTEAGLGGVTVKLYDGAGTYLNQSAITDGSGHYQFTALAAGTYIVGITTPAGYTKSDVGTTDIATDNQNDGVNVVTTEIRTNAFSFTASSNNIDFGLKGTASLGDFVWNDKNGNGIQDAGEPGISGATVTLTATGQATQTTTTNAGGIYSFTNLIPGTYTVTFSTPAGGYAATLANVGNDATDSDPIGGAVTGITLAAGQTNNTVDAGFYLPVSLGDFVWYDRNNNGIQEAIEHGIPNIAVKLYKDADGDNLPDGASVANTTTNNAGKYSFTNLAPGNYIVGITIPAGYSPSYTTVTGLTPNNDNATDNNGVTIAGAELRSNFITLSAGTEPDVAVDGDGTSGNNTLDFALKGLSSLGDFVWRDVNRDGQQQSGEPGIGKVLVTLTYPDASTTSTLTNDDGSYAFTNLEPGTYSLTFATPAGHYIPAPANVPGISDLVDSDPVNGVISNIVLAAGQVDNSNDAGFILQISLSGNVWHDVNGMDDNLVNNTGATQTPPAAPIPTGMRMVLVDASTGLVVGNALILASGTFNFPDVLPGTYTLVLSTLPGTIGQPSPVASLPTGWENTGEHLGITPGRDLVINGKLSVTVVTTDVTNANFGIRLSNSDGGVN